MAYVLTTDDPGLSNGSNGKYLPSFGQHLLDKPRDMFNYSSSTRCAYISNFSVHPNVDEPTYYEPPGLTYYN